MVYSLPSPNIFIYMKYAWMWKYERVLKILVWLMYEQDDIHMNIIIYIQIYIVSLYLCFTVAWLASRRITRLSLWMRMVMMMMTSFAYFWPTSSYSWGQEQHVRAWEPHAMCNIDVLAIHAPLSILLRETMDQEMCCELWVWLKARKREKKKKRIKTSNRMHKHHARDDDDDGGGAYKVYFIWYWI